MKTNILYIHGFNGNSQGGTYQALKEFSSRISKCTLHTFQFEKLHTDVPATQRKIEEICREKDINLLVGASLGGFYALVARIPVRKIAINPCMIPSVEIPLLKDRATGEAITLLPSVISNFKKLESYDIYSSAYGIFGKQDETFHFDENHNFSPLFQRIFHSQKKNFVLIDGKHSLEQDELEKGFFPALDYFGIKHE
ncbi:MAG: hypothetical protein IKO57_12600 [Treponema sp.]|nr:hypothetical protein [Treponema sp.]